MKVFILTGAGISAESGVKTFRDFENGLWNNHKIEDVCQKGCFEKNPIGTYNFYEDLKKSFDGCEPNDGHKIIVDIQKNHNVMLVTQNIDNLHEKAGSKNVLHMHGSLYKGYCVKCGETYENNDFNNINCLECGAINSVRHDIVFFQEFPYYMEEIQNFIDDCDVFVAIGTSGVVYPAAGFVQYANQKKVDKRIFININENDCDKNFNKKLIGKATEKTKELFELLEKLNE